MKKQKKRRLPKPPLKNEVQKNRCFKCQSPLVKIREKWIFSQTMKFSCSLVFCPNRFKSSTLNRLRSNKRKKTLIKQIYSRVEAFPHFLRISKRFTTSIILTFSEASSDFSKKFNIPKSFKNFSPIKTLYQYQISH